MTTYTPATIFEPKFKHRLTHLDQSGFNHLDLIDTFQSGVGQIDGVLSLVIKSLDEMRILKTEGVVNCLETAELSILDLVELTREYVKHLDDENSRSLGLISNMLARLADRLAKIGTIFCENSGNEYEFKREIREVESVRREVLSINEEVKDLTPGAEFTWPDLGHRLLVSDDADWLFLDFSETVETALHQIRSISGVLVHYLMSPKRLDPDLVYYSAQSIEFSLKDVIACFDAFADSKKEPSNPSESLMVLRNMVARSSEKTSKLLLEWSSEDEGDRPQSVMILNSLTDEMSNVKHALHEINDRLREEKSKKLIN